MKKFIILLCLVVCIQMHLHNHCNITLPKTFISANPLSQLYDFFTFYSIKKNVKKHIPLHINKKLNLSELFFTHIYIKQDTTIISLKDFILEHFQSDEITNAYMTKKGLIQCSLQNNESSKNEITIDLINEIVTIGIQHYTITSSHEIQCIYLLPKNFKKFIQDNSLDNHLGGIVKWAFLRKIGKFNGYIVTLYSKTHNFIEIISVDKNNKIKYLYGNGIGDLSHSRSNAFLAKYEKYIQPIISSVHSHPWLITNLIQNYAMKVL